MSFQTSQTISNLLVDVQNVTYTHWNKTEPTLKNISLQIYRRTLNVLVGPCGSGKTTLCDLFHGVIPHLHGGELYGDVWVDGLNTRSSKVYELALKVGRVFQDPETMFATLQVEDEVAFGAENLCFDVTVIRETVQRLLSETGLQAQRHNLVWNLSGGELQKLGLAAVLAMHPQLIILDEPTSNLDPSSAHSVYKLLLSLRAAGITVILVTRELDEFLAEADQLLVLENGRLLTTGAPRDVIHEYGEYMSKSLGIWLPASSEIGIELYMANIIPRVQIPITVEETLAVLLAHYALKGAALTTSSPVKIRPSKESPILISAKDLSYSYLGGTEALKSISLTIRAGEWVMIVGSNGAGKSTLAHLLVGLLKPKTGDLTLFGKRWQQWKIQELANYIALVFQNPEHQFLTDSVSEEISYSLTAQGIADLVEKNHRTNELLALLGLQSVSSTHPFVLNSGLKRRLGVATMLAGNPQVLLVDEPTYGQDKAMTHTLMSLMQQIRERGVAVVMITHDMRLVQEYGERVVVMSSGQKLYDGPSAGLFELNEVLAQANLRRTILHDVLSALRSEGLELRGEVRNPANLVNILKSRDDTRYVKE